MKNFKYFIVSFILIICFVLFACSENKPIENNPDTTDNTIAEVPKNNERKIYKHVLLIGVDGAGAYFKDADTPNLDRIFKDGNVTYDVRAEAPTYSFSNWISIFHGIESNVHKMYDKTYVPYPSESDFPSIFRAILEQNPDASVTSVAWDTLNVGLIEKDINVNKITTQGGDFFTVESVCQYLDNNGAPTFLFTAFGDVDVVAHDDSWGGAGHLGLIRNTDVLIGAIYNKYEELGILDDTLIMVTSNHGGYGKDHGGNRDSEKYVMFAISGDSVIKNGCAEDMAIRDVAAITMYALGLDSPENWTARVPEGIFDGVGGEERNVYVLDSNTRYRETLPTPYENSEKYITNYISDKTLEYYLTFDGAVEDKFGNEITVTDDYHYIDGIFGEGIRLDNGYLTIPEYSNGGEAFTIAMWLQIKSDYGNPIILTNKDQADTNSKGFSVAIENIGGKPYITETIGDESSSVYKFQKLPSDYVDGWVHLIFAYDPSEETAKISIDFGEFKNIKLNDDMSADSFESNSPMYIGFYPDREDLHAFDGAIDEFMQFSGCFTDEDVLALEAYYGK
ncbi:MAG: alkaline phosphatase family protein [Clostridia bacterium]|nr:alkaline phosphatase family protein [Clostridia bacterium]